ncbi:MAG: hybrid sensor histidine kinase/response regulator [Desulfobacteraceae bacterium]|nr:hybrid sensor histidine kinase/response regulator [Desulfobacteraceae bacterium]
MAFDRSKFIQRFIEDSGDHLREMNKGLIALADTPSDPAVMDAVFRAAHTIKGSSRMMKLIHISDMAHLLEDVLDGLRKKKLPYSNAISNVLFEGMDTLSRMMEALSRGDETAGPNGIIKQLKRAAGGDLPEDAKNNDPPEDVLAPGKGESESPANEARDIPGHGEGPAPDKQPEKESTGEPLLEKADSGKEKNSKKQETIRVMVEKLDGLINLMGEVVSTHKTVESHARRLSELFLAVGDFQTLLERNKTGTGPEDFEKRFAPIYAMINTLNQGIHDYLGVFAPLMSQLQTRSLEMRMLPLSTIFDSLHMVVRDLCRGSGKKVFLEVTGGETEMDKKMMEQLKDPLIHMVRNCIDHGMEAEDLRVKAGKPSHGTIRISAAMDGGSVHIVIADDGGGIPVDRVAQKALTRGIITESALGEMGPSDVIQLIFHPGLSTAETITDISGRGVGMDVVRQNIENDLNGAISVDTTPGLGSTFHILLPETLAIIHVFIVTLESVLYAVPASHVTEIVKVPGNKIINAQGKAVLRLRGELVPVVPMGDVLGCPPRDGKLRESPFLLILISGQGEERLGMVIDTLVSEEEQVVKPLPLHMRGVELVTGTIISDTHGIILVLHMIHMIEQAKKIDKTGEWLFQDFQDFQDRETMRPHLLVVDDSVTTREIEKSILESNGYKVTLAQDGVDGLNRAMEFAYDLIVSDVDMPGLTGFAMIEKIRSTTIHAHTPIVLISARDSRKDMQKGIEAGASAYIVKGDFDKNNLLETIDNLLGAV